MYSLLIDTHDTMVSFVLYKDETVLDLINLESKMRHSEIAMPVLIDLLNKYDLEINNIKEIIVVIGPGSFTGVRIGVVIAKTIAYLLNIPIKAITSLDLQVLSNSNIKEGTYVVSEKNGFFVGKYDNKGKLINEINYYNKLDFENMKLNDVIENVKIDYNNIYEHVKFIPSQNPHLLNPLYVKKIEALK